MESLTYLKNIKLTPKKMRMMLDNIKKLQPQAALDFLMYTPNKEAKVYYKAIHSAINNAKQTLKVSADVLQFKIFTIEEGRALRRYVTGSRGTMKPIKRRYSHIKIILIENPQLKAEPKKPAKVTKKEAVKAPVEKKVAKSTKESKSVKKELVSNK